MPQSRSQSWSWSWRCWTFSRVENLFHMPARVSGPEASSRPAEPHVRWIAKVLWCPGEATAASPRFIIRPNAAQLAGISRKCAQAACDGQQPVRRWPLWLEKKRLEYILPALSRWNRWPAVLFLSFFELVQTEGQCNGWLMCVLCAFVHRYWFEL